MTLLSAKIGLRYAYARRGSHFVSLNALLAVLGIIIGIAALIVVLSVMNGVISQLRSNLLSMTAHASIRPTYEATLPPDFNPAPYLAHEPSVRAWAPMIYGQGMIGTDASFEGAYLEGIDPKAQAQVSPTFARLPEAAQKALAQAQGFNIVLGVRLAAQLGVKVGDKVTVIVPQASISAAGILPRLKSFHVVGLFKSGQVQFDRHLALINLSDAARLFRLPQGASSIIITLKDAFAAPILRAKLNQELPRGLYASDWSRDQGALFHALQTEKTAMFVILCLIILVAAFGLLSSMYMVVSEKRRDIAILRTMGMTRARIRNIFLAQGMIFGALGTCCGVALGILISLHIPEIMRFIERHTGYVFPQDIYSVKELSAKIDPAVVLGVSAVALGLTLLFSIIPALIAARTEPARALSQE